MRPKAIEVKILDNYELEILFDNSERRIFDVKPYFKFELFKKLQDKNEFKKLTAIFFLLYALLYFPNVFS